MNIITLANQIKSLTLTNHQQVEKALMQKMRSVKNEKQYLEILYLFYGYFTALENLLGKFITSEQLESYQDRRKTTYLINDIKYFGGKLPHLAEPIDLPKIDNHLQAFGALYVMEGSTLGGLIISKIMQKQLNLDTLDGFSFFNAYGDDTQAMWLNFQQSLNAQANNSHEAQIIIDAANETFLMFKHWIENN